MSEIQHFPGFLEPQENYYRLPNKWQDHIALLREAYGNRFAAPLKLLEYLLKHTWGASKFDGRLCLSADEIRNGRRGHSRQRLDSGTGLSDNAISRAGKILAEIGFISIKQDDCDKARRMHTYQILLSESET